MRFLGIDLGQTRVGVALSAAAGKMALPLEILERDDNIDNLVLLITTRFITMGFITSEHVDSSIELMAETKKRTSKPVMAIVSYSTPNDMRSAREVIQKFQRKGVPAFPSISRGTIALRNSLDYYRMKSKTRT